MSEASRQRCDQVPLGGYLSGELSEAEIACVEQHLDDCAACAMKLQQQAAPAAQWSQVSGWLSDDGLDQPKSAASSFDPFVDAPQDSEHEDASSADDPQDNAALMLTREIRGWLDPSDDPRMLGRFAGYEIVGIIGHGGMGIVLKGFEVSLNRYVAIKAMAPRLACSEAARTRFAREAQAAAGIIHENIIAIHRVDQTHGLPFLVMPYTGGASLQHRIDERGPLCLEESLQIASQVAAGLAAAHAQGLIHRDIKPANILLDEGTSRVKITDFGLARAADDAPMTRTGMIAGTPQFMSPEQARGRKLDARSDLFSLGSVLYTMLAGRPPFSGVSSYDVVDAVAEKTPIPLTASPTSQSQSKTKTKPTSQSQSQASESQSSEDERPEWIGKLVGLMHRKDAKQRVTSATQVQQLLDACLQHLRDPRSPLPSELQSDRRPSRMWIVGIVVLLVAGIWVAMRPPESTPVETAPVKQGQESETKRAAEPSPELRTSNSEEALSLEMDVIEAAVNELEAEEW